MRVISRSAFFLLLLIVVGVSGAVTIKSQAATTGEEPGSRKTEIVASITEYQWWLVRWDTNEIACIVSIESDDQPRPIDVLTDCGEDIYDEWISSSPCAAAQDLGNVSSCPGLYIFQVGQETIEKTVIVDLPTPTIWLELSGCSPQPPLNRCDRLPTLVFTAEEPLPNEGILAIHVLMEDGKIVDCGGNRCEIPAQPTFIEGEEIEFWADSTYGDESEHFTARVRIIDTGVPTDGFAGNWFIDIISDQYRGQNLSSCAAMWGAFPTIGGGPQWLSTPDEYRALASNTAYVYLAGELIRTGQVDASTCLDLGLQGNGVASQCGLEAARSKVNDWQDQFDLGIFNAAQEHDIPAQLLKNLFAQESQFWPGQTVESEYGLGQLTEQGADTTLLWNVDFYNQFCPLMLHEETCSQGYAFLGKENQELLRGALASQSGALCSNCAIGVDLSHAATTIDLFAETLIANCAQVAFISSDITDLPPGVNSSFEDLWRFTLSSYNAGPSCLAKAMNEAWRRNRKMDWTTVSSKFSSGCSGAILYVDRITRDRLPSDADFIATATPTVTPTPKATNTPTATPINITGTPAATNTPASTLAPPTPTATPVNYPAPATATPSSDPTATPISYP